MQMSIKVGSVLLGVIVVAGVVFAVTRSAPSPETAPIENETMQNKQQDTMMNGEDTTKKEDDAMMKKDEGAMMKKGSYETYAPEKLASAKSGDVVLFFRASWCPTCRSLDADIRANLSDIPDGLVILDVDYDHSSELKKKYGVTYQHTLVQVDDDGNQIAKWSGSPTLSALAAQVK